MPPFMKYSTSLAVSMRHSAVKVKLAAILAGDCDRHVLTRLEIGDAGDGEAVVAGEAQAVARVAILELERQHAHADEVGAVDALEALDDDGAHAQQVGALGRPVTAGAGAVFLAGDHDHRRAVGLVLHRAS
jgi:hypothetical protein